MYPFHLPALKRRDTIVGAAFAALIALATVSGCEEGTEPTAAGNRPDLTSTAAATGNGEAVGEVTPQGTIALPINQSVATTGANNPAFGVTQTGTGPDGVFKITNTTNAQNALLGQTSGRGIAVRGLATGASGRAGVFETTTSTGNQDVLFAKSNGNGTAVHAVANGFGMAGHFEGVRNSGSNTLSVSALGSGSAVSAFTTGTGQAGMFVISNADNAGAAILGQTNGTGSGIHGSVTGGRGIAGLFTVTNSANSNPAVLGSSNSSGNGVVGLNSGTGRAGAFVISNSNSPASALYAETNRRFTGAGLSTGAAIYAVTKGQGSAGVFSNENAGTISPALHAVTNGSIAAAHFVNTRGGQATALQVNGKSFFLGDVQIFGTLRKSAGSFEIDHPLDPEHKYLSHSFVESPDMLNVYDGTAMLDGRGEAVVMLPAYFEALNRDFRYQLTAIGAPGPNLHIGQKIRSNRFVIAGGVPGAEVSWLVTGVRQDTYAEAHRIQVETDKPADEPGVALTH